MRDWLSVVAWLLGAISTIAGIAVKGYIDRKNQRQSRLEEAAIALASSVKHMDNVYTILLLSKRLSEEAKVTEIIKSAKSIADSIFAIELLARGNNRELLLKARKLLDTLGDVTSLELNDESREELRVSGRDYIDTAKKCIG